MYVFVFRIENEIIQDEKNEQIENQRLDTQTKILRNVDAHQGGFMFKATDVMVEDPFPAQQVPMRELTAPESPYLRTAIRSRVSTN